MTSGRPPGPLILVVDDVADNREVYGQILAFTTTWSSHACPTTSWPPSDGSSAPKRCEKPAVVLDMTFAP